MTHPHVAVAHDGPVCTVTLNNPDLRNAQTPSMWVELSRIGRQLPDEVRVVVLRGAGPDFSAGLHRGMFTPEGVPDEIGFTDVVGPHGDQLIARFQQAFTVWRSTPAIVVAAVRGNAIGAGFQLALAADLRIATDTARFAMKEVTLGLVPDLGGTWPLVEAVGRSRALELCATGRFLSGREAADWGVVTRAVPEADFDDAITELVDSLLDTPPAALRAIKPLIARASSNTADQQLAAERATQLGLMQDLVHQLSARS